MKDALLTILRSKDTDPAAFRKAAHTLSDLIAAEIASEAEEAPKEVLTTNGKVKGSKLLRPPILIPILRAGMALLPSFLHFFDTAKVGFIGIRRDKEAKPIIYYTHLPKITSEDHILILDPMIATAGSTLTTIRQLIDAGAKEENITVVAILAAPEGIEALEGKYPNVLLHITQVDEGLNDIKYIVPGLGDFGDMYYNTV